ncbi:hypothetical protein LAD59_27160 [Klebsiella pneumoniae]|nr:hypothetical protein [Klebsiella pneumoniae]
MPSRVYYGTARWQRGQCCVSTSFGSPAGIRRRRGDEQRSDQNRRCHTDQMSNEFPALASHQERLQPRRSSAAEAGLSPKGQIKVRAAVNACPEGCRYASLAVALPQAARLA